MSALLATTSKIGALRSLLHALLLEHKRDGAIPTDARFLFYELVQRELLSKNRTGVRRADQNLHDALTDLREAGIMRSSKRCLSTFCVDVSTSYCPSRWSPFKNASAASGIASSVLCGGCDDPARPNHVHHHARS